MTSPLTLTACGCLGGLTGDRFNPTGWLEPITEQAIDALAGWDEDAYAVDGLCLQFDRRTWEDAYEHLEALGIGVIDPGRGVITRAD